jgi:hypothetical protein
MSTKEDEKLTEYRISELENNFKEMREDLKIVKEAVLRWDAKLTNDSQAIDILKKDVEMLKVFKWKAAGAIAVGMLFIQIFGGTIARAVFPEKSSAIPKIEYQYPSRGTNGIYGYINK